ncbi:MAG: indolepyruvate oxidoreductase subunit beta [Bacteroidales bacterium]|jgi:indolepyruvate ferredoxin oxidoreductase beta subunit|nr:indolepyruvate oxidoreductase subunit beta [Bacteroidales bacterium]
MKTDIILAGVGGQGILSIAAVIGWAAIDSRLYIKQAEIHGMSQRGGAVYSHLRLSDAPVASDLIPTGKANVILSVEPMEALRYLPYLSGNGWVVTNTRPFVNIDNYPDAVSLTAQLEALDKRILVNADELATRCGNSKAANMVMLGAAVPFLGIDVGQVETAVRNIFERKGNAMVDLNVNALHEGYTTAQQQMSLRSANPPAS